MEEVETDEPVASPLDEITSTDEISSSASSMTSAVDAAGRIVVTKTRAKGAMPSGPEQFRMKLRVECNTWIYLSGKFTSKQWLQGMDPPLWQRYCDYFLGSRCNTMETVDAQGNKTPLRPPWSLVLGYELECRKHAFEQVREEGAQLGQALIAAIRDSEIKENSFTSPLALMSRAGKGKGRFHADDTNSDIPPPPGKRQRGRAGRGRGRGREGEGRGRGRGEGRGRSDGQDLVSVTPDGRQICFNYSSAAGCTNASCSRVHCCRVRGCQAEHKTSAHAAGA